MNKTILITGGCGFVGSNLAVKFKEKYSATQVIAFDNLKRRGSELNLTRLHANGVKFVHGDLRIKSDLDEIKHADIIIDAAAEPSVLAGIDQSPDYLFNTNLTGTYNLLELAKKLNSNFIFLSTSRIYPIKQLESINLHSSETRFEISDIQHLPGISKKGIAENFPLNGSRSLYGATKLASELFVQEYTDIFGLKTVINRCGVLTGPHQMGKVDQGVAVLWMAKHFWNLSLAYIGYGGTGKQVRDILHIDDLFSLIEMQIDQLNTCTGEIFNIGGGTEISVSLQEMTKICENITENKIEIKSIEENRKADIPLYITDTTKIREKLGWKPKKNTECIFQEIFNWIKNNEEQLRPILA